MNILKYQSDARTTAVYPAAVKIAYPTLGLVGELGEYTDKVGDPKKKNDELLHELGDVLWYVANLCCDLELFIIDLFEGMGPEADIDDIKARFMFDDDLLVEVGKISEAVKKILRDGNKQEKVEIVKKSLARILEHVSSEAWGLESDLTEVAAMNLEKLQSRQDRGVLKGDGDNR